MKFIMSKDPETIDNLRKMGLKETTKVGNVVQFAINESLKLDFSNIDKNKITFSNVMYF